MKRTRKGKLLYCVALGNGQTRSLKRIYFSEDFALWYAKELVRNSHTWSTVVVWVQEEGKDKGSESLIFRAEGTKEGESWDQ